MKKMFTTLALALIVSATMATPRGNVIVVANGQRVELTPVMVQRVKAASRNASICQSLSTMQTIQYNDTADRILSIYKTLSK